jgi:Uncharacterized alpha/beta hydrolase domain (DUF2235)
MKRIVVLIDGTWGKEGTGLDTNVAKLDCGKKVVTQAFIKARATNGTVQNVHYHDGVGGWRRSCHEAPRWSCWSRAQKKRSVSSRKYPRDPEFRSRRPIRRRPRTGGHRHERDAGNQPRGRALRPLGARRWICGLHALAVRPRRRRAAHRGRRRGLLVLIEAAQ